MVVVSLPDLVPQRLAYQRCLPHTPWKIHQGKRFSYFDSTTPKTISSKFWLALGHRPTILVNPGR